MQDKTNPITAEILVAVTKRSSLKTIFIEGNDDLIVFNILKDYLDDSILVDIFPCNGRTNLLKMYNSKNEFTEKCLFFCDSDTWIFDHLEYSRICSKFKLNKSDFFKTVGYSIENDLFMSNSTVLLNLLTHNEKHIFDQVVSNVCHWFAYQMHLKQNGEETNYANIKICSEKFIDSTTHKIIDKEFNSFDMALIDSKLLNTIISNYNQYLKGKFIFEIFIYIFKARNHKKNSKPNYKKEQIFDLITCSVINTPNSFLCNHIKYINNFFS